MISEVARIDQQVDRLELEKMRFYEDMKSENFSEHEIQDKKQTI